MSLWVILPVKPLQRAKSRLADVLSPQQRSDFAEAMLRHILQVVTNVPQVTGTLVISRDPKALSIARDYGAKTVQESSTSDLNPALERATEVVRLWKGGAVLILPADLPFVTTEDIVNIAELGIEDCTVVLATDHLQDGTNAMLVRPAGLIPYQYGKNSFTNHARLARSVGAIIKYYDSDTIKMDIDVPDDLERYNQQVMSNTVEMLPPFLPDIIP